MTSPPTRLPIVGVMGSGTRAHAHRSEPLGRWLASAGVHLLTGGGSGVMASVSRAFCEAPDRRGLVIGILPADGSPTPSAPVGYPNPWVELPIRTHLHELGTRGAEPLSRNHLNVLSAEVIIALPGSAGTSSEVRLDLRYGRPLVAFVTSRDEIEDLPDEVAIESELHGIQRFVRAALPMIGT